MGSPTRRAGRRGQAAAAAAAAAGRGLLPVASPGRQLGPAPRPLVLRARAARVKAVSSPWRQWETHKAKAVSQPRRQWENKAKAVSQSLSQESEVIGVIVLNRGPYLLHEQESEVVGVIVLNRGPCLLHGPRPAAAAAAAGQTRRSPRPPNRPTSTWDRKAKALS